MTLDALSDSAGPSSPPPPLPDGWLAQWEGIQRKWYFVQRTTGKSQWEVPKDPVIFSPSTTPLSTGIGPSRVPSSGLEKEKNIRVDPGEWPFATTADEAYDVATARRTGSGSGSGQHSAMSQDAYSQIPFGYVFPAQAGSYGGVSPQYTNPLSHPGTGQATPEPKSNAANVQTVTQHVEDNAIYPPNQPQWHVGQQQQHPNPFTTTKSNNSSPDIARSRGPAIENPLNPSHHSQTNVDGFPQHHQRQNLARAPFASQSSPRNLSFQQSHYLPTGPVPVFNTTEGLLPSGAGSPYANQLPHPDNGTPNSAQGYAIPQPSLQQAVSAAQPLRPNSQDPYSQAPMSQQAHYTASNQYLGYDPVRMNASGAVMPMVDADHHGMPFVSANLQPRPSTWGAQYPPERMTPLSPASSVSHPGIGGYSSVSPHAALPQNYQGFQPQPQLTPGISAAPSYAPDAEWTTGPGSVLGRAAMSDPQFVSGPWASGVSPAEPELVQPNPYGGPVEYKS